VLTGINQEFRKKEGKNKQKRKTTTTTKQQNTMLRFTFYPAHERHAPCFL
jgi:hypothetical protein